MSQRADDADPAAEPLRQAVEQRLGAHLFAGQTVADPDGQGRRQRLVVEHDVEVGIEGRDLVDLRHGNDHEVGERVKVAGLEAAPGVLDEMEVLDQQVAPVGTFADRFPDIRPGRVVEDPAFRVRRRLATPGSRMNFTFDEPSCLAGLPDPKLRHRVILVSIFSLAVRGRRLSAFLRSIVQRFSMERICRAGKSLFRIAR